MLLMIDNYDSFTYNLVQYFGELGEAVSVYRNDRIDIPHIRQLDPEAIVISPGPGRPADAGISCELIRTVYAHCPILGVCLGHQCIAEVFGGRIIRASRIMHGKTSPVHHDGSELFAGIPSPFDATRYHSLIADPEKVPDDLIVTARTAEGEIMGLAHRRFCVHGIQFHPESILTRPGRDLLKNFMAIARGWRARGRGAR